MVVTSCGANDKSSSPSRSTDYSYAENSAAYDMNESDLDYMFDTVTKQPSENITDTRKIIKSINVTLETLEFDKAVEDIKSQALSQGGYIESSNIQGSSINDEYSLRKASFVIRVPATKLESYVDTLNVNYNVLQINENSSDITDQYYDAQSRLNSLLTQEERLLFMLEGATELQYMLEIERHLADVRYQIENYHSTLTRYDNQVSMSTVSISLQEVVKYQVVNDPPRTFGQRFVSAISGSWNNFVFGLQNFVINFVYALPGLLTFFIVVTVIVIVVVFVVKRIYNKNKKNIDK